VPGTVRVYPEASVIPYYSVACAVRREPGPSGGAADLAAWPALRRLLARPAARNERFTEPTRRRHGLRVQ